MLKLEWPEVDMRRKEFTLRKTKNGETRVIPMTPDVHAAFSELWKDRRLDTNRVFLYKGKPWKNPQTAFAAAPDLRHTASTNLRRAGVDTMTAMKIVATRTNRCTGGIIRFSRRTSTRPLRSFRSIRLTL